MHYKLLVTTVLVVFTLLLHLRVAFANDSVWSLPYVGGFAFHNNPTFYFWNSGVNGSAVQAVEFDSGTGLFGYSGNGLGVFGFAGSGQGISAYAANGVGIYSTVGSGWAGLFDGSVYVRDGLYAGAKFFRIDHPLAPADKYLVHTSVESPDALNIYSGNVTTDTNGDATVTLPSYFEAVNCNFRYQLTVIGQFAQAIVANEMQDNRFTIKTDKPNVKVSWQVIGIRHDAYSQAHSVPVEQDKPVSERGYYLDPEAHGQPASKGLLAQQRALQNRLAPEVAPQFSLRPKD